MKKLEYTRLASFAAVVALTVGSLAILAAAYLLLIGSTVGFLGGQLYEGVMWLASGFSLVCLAALLGTVSEISHNIAALGKQTSPELPQQIKEVQPDAALRKSAIPEVVSGNWITKK